MTRDRQLFDSSYTDGGLCAIGPPGLDRVYRNYVASCRRLGIEPMTRECIDALSQVWFDALGRPQGLRQPRVKLHLAPMRKPPRIVAIAPVPTDDKIF